MCFDLGKGVKKGNLMLSVQGGVTERREEKKSWEIEQLCRVELLHTATLLESWLLSQGGLDADSQWGVLFFVARYQREVVMKSAIKQIHRCCYFLSKVLFQLV